jgi:hypothetical protein
MRPDRTRGICSGADSPGHVQERAEHLVHRVDGSLDAREEPCPLGGVGLGLQLTHEQVQCVKRLSQVVACRSKKPRLMRVRELELMTIVPDLVEQARILDRDDRLVGEGRHQLDLLLGEGPHLRSPDSEYADHPGLPQHGDSEDRADLAASLVLGPGVLGIGVGVVDVNDAALDERPTGRGLAARSMRMPPQDAEELGRIAVSHGHPIDLPVLAIDDPLVRVT